MKRSKSDAKGLKIALALGALWLLALIVIWFAYRNDDGSGGGFWNFVGRFHILIVHVPIGVIYLAVVMDLLGRWKPLSHLKVSVPFVLWIAFLGSIAATAVGYLLMEVEGFAGRAVDFHLYFGLAVVVATLVALVASLLKKELLTTLGLFASAFTTAAAGHFGGAMVHEADYLSEHAPAALVPLLDIGLKAPEPTEVASTGEKPISELLLYADLAVPILAAKCTECHDANKIKAELRMDTLEFLLAGAKDSDYPTLIPGNAQESEMIVRVLLPSDHDEFMPTKGPGLTPEEIELLVRWIDHGATAESTVADLGDDPEIETLVQAVLDIHSTETDETLPEAR